MSFDEFAPNFVQRFIESHIVMLTGNAGLKPKEGEYTSRPWEWIINIRGQGGSCSPSAKCFGDAFLDVLVLDVVLLKSECANRCRKCADW